jgi:hypothetical protein
MRRSLLRAVAVVALVVVAGCGGGVSDGQDAPSSTSDAVPTGTPSPTPPPATSPTTVTETRTDERFTYPPGWSATGVENATLALDTHYRAVLAGPSATVTYRSREVVTDDGAANNTTLEMSVDTGERRLFASIDGVDDHRQVFFADGTLTRWRVRDRAVVGRSTAHFGRVAQSVDRRVLTSQLLLYTLEHERTVRRNGSRAVVYDVTGVYDNTVSRTYGSGESGSGTLVVGERGRLLALDTRVEYTGGTVTYTYAQTRLGETEVATPEWIGRE